MGAATPEGLVGREGFMDHSRWQAARNPDNPVTLTPALRGTLKNGREVQSLVKVTNNSGSRTPPLYLPFLSTSSR